MTEHKHKDAYGRYAGNPSGRRPDLSKCIEEVGECFDYRQCSRNLGHGPDGMYCKQHAKRFNSYKQG